MCVLGGGGGAGKIFATMLGVRGVQAKHLLPCCCIRDSL